jgi:hypothetical protein
MAFFILSVIAGFIDALHDLELPSVTGACVDKKEALKRARKSLPWAYVVSFQNSVGPLNQQLNQLIDYVSRKMEARIGSDALQMQSHELLKARATRANASDLDTVFQESSPLLFLVAIKVAGWFDELVAPPSAWGIQGEDVANWLKMSRNRDLIPWRKRIDVRKDQIDKDIYNFLQRFRRVKVWETDEAKARWWLINISKEYLVILGKHHVLNYGGNGGGNGGGSGGSSGGGGAVGASTNVAVRDR